MGNLMDSHDKARFLAYADGDIARDAPDDKEVGWLTDIRVDDVRSYRLAELYLAYLLTTPGVPTIYYGDEIGMTGANDPDNRRPMRWGNDVTPDEQALRERVSQLVRLRRDRSALRRGGFHTLLAEGDVWAYLRAGAAGRTLVALNKGDAPETVTLNLPAALAPSDAADAFTGQTVPVKSQRVTLTVPATGYRIVDLGTAEE
jgi:glycosidase